VLHTYLRNAVPTARFDPSLHGFGSNWAYYYDKPIDLEQAADAILDLLLAREASPLQSIAIEQCALLLGAAGREAFSDLRKRSGSFSVDGTDANAVGRSRRGLVLDPLGLFRGSPLIENDERDAQALAAATKLAALADELLPAGLDGTGRAGGKADALLLSPQELRELGSMLAFKVVDRRDDLQVVMRRFAATLLDQASQRAFRRGAFRGPSTGTGTPGSL